MSMKPPYCEIHGLVCTDVISSVNIDGGEEKTTTQSIYGRRCGLITKQGRNPRKITLNARFLTEEDLDAWIGHINSAPEDCEAYPFRDDRCAYIKSASARVIDPVVATIGGEYTTFFRGKAELHTQEPWMYGIEKGARYESPQALPITISDLEHEGTVEALAVLDKLCARGQYVYGAGYVENLALTFTPGNGDAVELLLCTKMMRNDLFEVDRFGSVLHSYENDFDCTISAFQADLQSAAYMAYCSITDGKLTIDGEGRCIFPFYGPLPISAEKPFLEIDVDTIGQYAPKIVAGVVNPEVYSGGFNPTVLKEITTNPLHEGINRIYLSGFAGQGDFFMGFIERKCWIAAPNMITARSYTAGGGNPGNAICIAGWVDGTQYNISHSVEEFNGTAWSEGGDLATSRRMHAGDGGGTDAICMGGYTGAQAHIVSTEEYNGTAWSAGGNLATARNLHCAGGSSTNALCMGGHHSASFPYYTASTEKYNGTAWSAAGDLYNAKQSLGGGGNATSAICCGGYDFYQTYASCELYAGTAWEYASGLLRGRVGLAVDGDYSDGLAVGGSAGARYLGDTEEYDGSAWSVGGYLISGRHTPAGGGLAATGAICMGGRNKVGLLASAETYGGNSSLVLNSIKAVVHRYIDPEMIPTVDPGDTFELKIDGDGATELAYLELYFRDAWWF